MIAIHRRNYSVASRLLLVGILCLSFLMTYSPAAAVGPSLVQVIDTSQWLPPNPDPAGITYWAAQNRLVVVDSEVEETSIYAGVNVFTATTSGTLDDTANTLSFTNEPVAIDFDPVSGHAFVADDSDREIFEVDLGADGVIGTSDDVVTSFFTTAFGNNDPEGLTLGEIGGQPRLFIVDAAGREVYILDPGSNGRFDGVAPAGDDQVTHFDTDALGARDTEGIDFNPDTGTL